MATEQLTQLLTAGVTPDPDVGGSAGAFGLALLFAGHDDLLICARRGSPLAIGDVHRERLG